MLRYHRKDIVSPPREVQKNASGRTTKGTGHSHRNHGYLYVHFGTTTQMTHALSRGPATARVTTPQHRLGRIVRTSVPLSYPRWRRANFERLTVDKQDLNCISRQGIRKPEPRGHYLEYG